MERRGDPRPAAPASPGAAGFTLLEVLAVVLLTLIVITAALNHYVDLSRATERASHHTRSVRRATALLDRMARDFESVVLVAKPAERDPLDHPWIFYGEARRGDTGADQLKFITRGNRPRRSAEHESDLAVVAYSLRASEEDFETFELMRWSTTVLPEGLDRGIPSDEADGARLLADGLLDFGVVFIDETGSEQRQWDSSQIAESSALPSAVTIQVAFADPRAADNELAGDGQVFQRTVPLRVAPLDMEVLLDPTSLGNGGDQEEEAEDEEDEELDEDERAAKQCKQTPCAGQPACSVVNCQAKLGRFGQSMDLLIQDAIQENKEFCAWRYGISHQVRALIVDNVACR